jgi:outer membrane protein
MTMTRTIKRLGVIACGLTLALAASAAHAQASSDQDTQPHAGTVALKLGGAGIFFQSSGNLRLAGQPLTGANLKLTDNSTAIFEGEYWFRRDLSVSLTVGVPPSLSADGRGTLAPLGKLGSISYGPGAVLAKYHVGDFGRFQPYIAGGATRMLIFSDTDGAITKLKVHPAWGGAVQGGADYMFNQHWGVFASATHLFLRTHGEGSFSGLPVTAKIALDPNIVIGGLTYRF